MKKKDLLKKNAKLWALVIPFLSRKGLIDDFIKEIEDNFEFGFFIGMYEALLEKDKKKARKMLGLD